MGSITGRLFKSLICHNGRHVILTWTPVMLPGGVDMTASELPPLPSSTHSGSHTYLHCSNMMCVLICH